MLKKLSLFLFAAGLACSLRAADIDQIQLAVSGKFKGIVQVANSDGALYLDARQTLKLLKATAYWAPKSGKLDVRLSGFAARLAVGSTKVSFPDSSWEMKNKVITRSGSVFVPLEFFLSEGFKNALGKEVSFNETANSLDVDSRYQLGEADYYSYGNRTRVSFETRGNIRYLVTRKTPRLFEITVPDVEAQTAETLSVADGVVNSVIVRQDGKSVKISVSLGAEAGDWNVSQDGQVLTVEVNAKNFVRPSEPSGGEEVPAPAVRAELKIPDRLTVSGSWKKRIVIDAGHGGRDPGGNKRKGLAEKALNLAIAKELAGLLSADGFFEVVMTRTSDYFIPLDARSAAANDPPADVFVSIHANAHNSRAEQGCEVYFMSEDASDPWAVEVAAFENAVRSLEDRTPAVSSAGILLHSLARNEYRNDSALLAGFISKSLDKGVPIKNRGVKQAPFYVLRGTYAPAVLIETGFMTNQRDVKALNDPATRKKIAKAIRDGIMSYTKSKGWQGLRPGQ